MLHVAKKITDEVTFIMGGKGKQNKRKRKKSGRWEEEPSNVSAQKGGGHSWSLRKITLATMQEAETETDYTTMMNDSNDNHSHSRGPQK